MRVSPATAALALALLLAAALFDAEPLWVAAVLLVVLLAASCAWVAAARRGVEVGRTISARRVVEDEPVAVLLEVRGSGLPLPAAMLSDPLLDEPAVHAAGQRQIRMRLEARFARRGRRRLAPTVLELSDPLGLASVRVSAAPAAGEDELLVLPRLHPITTPATADGGTRRHVVRRGREIVGAEVELDGIRPLREGTSAARIFWPSVARGGEPQERRLTADGDSRPVVVLDPRNAEHEEDLDAAVRAAASLARQLARTGGCGLLLPGDRRAHPLEPNLAAWPHAHARLAVVAADSQPQLGSLANRRGAVFFVSARRRTRLPAALGQTRGASRVLVVPGELDGRVPAFAVAGCHGYEIGAPRAARAPAGAA